MTHKPNSTHTNVQYTWALFSLMSDHFIAVFLPALTHTIGIIATKQRLRPLKSGGHKCANHPQISVNLRTLQRLRQLSNLHSPAPTSRGSIFEELRASEEREQDGKRVLVTSLMQTNSHCLPANMLLATRRLRNGRGSEITSSITSSV